MNRLAMRSRNAFGHKSNSGVKTRGVCRQCGDEQPVERAEWKWASPPRCISCGGLLDKKGTWGGANSVASVTKDLSIVYPIEESEFEVHAWLWCQLRQLGLDARGEVFAINGTSRFDIVLFDKAKRAVRIIEVKAKKHRKGDRRRSFRFNKCTQVKAYQMYGIPVDCIVGMDAAKEYVAKTASSMNLGTDQDERRYGLVNHGAE